MYHVYNILISAKILQNNRNLQSAADTKFFTSQNMKLISVLDELGTKQHYGSIQQHRKYSHTHSLFLFSSCI